MKKIFVNRFGKMRSGWKIALVLGISFGIQIVIGTVIGLALMTPAILSGNLDVESLSAAADITNSPALNFSFQLMGTILMIGAVYFVLRLIDKKRFKDIGFINVKKGFKHLIIGLIFGAVSMTIVFFILLWSNNIEVTNSFLKPQFSLESLTGLILFILVGFNEEIFSRGYCMMVLKGSAKKWVPVVVSSVIFSLLHLGNQNVKVFGLINIFLVGILFAYMVVKTNNIWMAIGYHITWNYFQGNVFGFPVSGNNSTGIYGINVLNDNYLTGGAFGPEAGVIATLVILAGLLILKFYKSGNESSELFSQKSESMEV